MASSKEKKNYAAAEQLTMFKSHFKNDEEEERENQ
jgi:hypothetical protein